MTSTMFSLESKTVLVTGACGLLGKEICSTLSDQGAEVIATDVDNSQGEELESRLENVRYEHMDISDPEQVQTVIDTVEQVNGIVNAAYPRTEDYGSKFEQVTYQEWNQNVSLHLGGYYLVCRKAVLDMIKSGVTGSIVNFGSIYGVQAPDFQIYNELDMTSPVEYSAIKAGIINLTRYLASYVGEFGIRVNAISPGGVYNNQDSKFVERYEKQVPLGRMADPDDITGAVVYLLSDASSYVTGENIVIDGGWTIK